MDNATRNTIVKITACASLAVAANLIMRSAAKKAFLPQPTFNDGSESTRIN